MMSEKDAEEAAPELCLLRGRDPDERQFVEALSLEPAWMFIASPTTCQVRSRLIQVTCAGICDVALRIE